MMYIVSFPVQFGMETSQNLEWESLSTADIKLSAPSPFKLAFLLAFPPSSAIIIHK